MLIYQYQAKFWAGQLRFLGLMGLGKIQRLLVIVCLLSLLGCSRESDDLQEQIACQSHLLNPAAIVLANGWNLDNESSRFQPANKSGINKKNINQLTLSWAYVFANQNERRSHPMVTEQAVIVSSFKGHVRALGRTTGCEIWQYKADAQVRTGFVVGQDKANERQLIYFGDILANVYAIDSRDGRLVWKRHIEKHKSAKITGSLKLYKKSIYIPVSSTEVMAAMSGAWKCCTFRGSLVALNAITGEPIWQTYIIADEPTYQSDIDQIGPSGAPIWATPTIDVKRNQVIIGSGQNYSGPATKTSDAIIAMDLNSGKINWVFQATKGDVWNMACLFSGPLSGNGKNCPKEAGPDFDFGAAPVLVSLQSGKQLLLAAQKSGNIFALDPQDGKEIWRRELGVGGNLGGTHWGIAVDKRFAYVPISDLQVNKLVLMKKNKKGEKSPRLSDDARPGITALDLATGEVKWHVKTLRKTANGETLPVIFSAAITVTDGIVFAGGLDGVLRGFNSDNGKLLWQFDTRKKVMGVNGIEGHGGAIDSGGPVLANGMMYVNSGYQTFVSNPKWSGGYGNVFLAFSVSNNRSYQKLRSKK